MAEPALDLRVSFRLLRRLWPWMVATCLVGAGVGAAFEVLEVAPYHATSLVLLPTSAGTSSSGTSGDHPTITTDVRVADSAAVLVPAARKAGSTLSLNQLQSRVSASPSTSGVVKITAAGTSARQATRLANAVAEQLVAFITTSGSTSNSNAVTTLKSEVKQVDRQITDVQGEKSTAQQQLAADGASSTAGKAESQLISKLTAQQSSLTLELDTLKSQLSNAQLQELSTNQGAEIIQRASAATGLSAAGFALPVALGVVGGLIVGYVAIVALSRRDRRLRSRDAIAQAVGAPVLFSMEARAPKIPRDWSELLEHYVPPPSTQWHVRRGLRELGVGAGGSEPKVLHVLAFGDDSGAAAAAVEISLVAAGAGMETLFSISGSSDAQVTLRSVCARLDAETRSPRTRLAVHNDPRGPTVDGTDAVVALHLLDRAEPEAGASWQRRDAVVLAVSAGLVTSEDLARAAIAVDVVGLRLGGIAVVNPASEDRTVGRFSEGAVRRSMVQPRRPDEKAPQATAPRNRRPRERKVDAMTRPEGSA